jgi:hypothetical protein
MNALKKIAILAAAAACLLTSCSSKPDAGVLVREAKSESAAMKSCEAVVTSTLVFTANGTSHSFRSTNKLNYHNDPFAVKSVQSSDHDGISGTGETYTVQENGGNSFYFKDASGWKKTSAGDLDTSPTAQIEPLRMLDNIEDQKYVRATEINSVKVHKIELKLTNEVLRSTIENIVTSSGMGNGSKTIVQTLLDSAPPIYGYYYLAEDSGKPVRFELDAKDALNRIFAGIDGNSVKVTVSQCDLSCDLSEIDSAPAVTLPDEAKSASSAQAQG